MTGKPTSKPPKWQAATPASGSHEPSNELSLEEIPVDLEIVQPVESISGPLYQSREFFEGVGTVDADGDRVQFVTKTPFVLDIDEQSGQQSAVERTDGIYRHLIRCRKRPVVEPPTGYYVTEPSPRRTRHMLVKDEQGRTVGIEREA